MDDARTGSAHALVHDPPSVEDDAAVLQSIITAAIDAIITTDDHGIVLAFNGGAEQAFGYRADEVIGRNVSMLMPEPQRSEHDAYLDRYRETGQRHIVGIGREVEARRKDGSTFPVHLAVSEVQTGGRRLFTGVARDTSDLREALRASRDSEQHLRLLVDGVADHALVLLDARGCVTQSNGGLERLTGYADGSLAGRHTSVFNEPDNDPGPLLTAAAERGSAESEGWCVRADGSRFAANIVITAIRAEAGELQGFAQVIRDVTERQMAAEDRERIEARLRQAERIESVGQLAGGVAHDFNNLLSVILSATTLIEATLDDAGLPPTTREALLADLGQIEQAGERGAALTRQLLTLGRRGVAQARPLDLDLAVSATSELLRRTLGENIELFVRPASNLRPILADRGQLDQVLVNIAVNARDAMPNGGSLTIETANVDLDDDFVAAEPLMVPGRYVRLTMTDTGEGMDADTLGRVFEPFFTTKPVGKGTGLGLATVYGIVTTAGGAVRLSSEPGVGTAVQAFLPAVDDITLVMGDPAVTESPTPPRSHGQHILLVEDEPAVRDLARRLLESEGYVVTAAADATEALELATTTARGCDLLLTDIIMPGMSGPELARRMRLVRPDLGVLYTSGYAAGTLGSQGKLEPGEHLLEKPFSRAALVQSIEEILGSE